MRDYNNVFEEFKKDDNGIEYFGKLLGKGAYGEVREVKLKNSVKMMASKLLKKENDEDMNEIIVAQDLKGYNIIKINKTISKVINDEEYELVIMEKAMLRDLGKLNEYFHKHNLLKLIIIDSFDEKIGDNLLRFYTKQIIDGLEILDRNYFVHFDIKPENLLIAINLNIKISDFSLVKKVKDEDKLKIPGGTLGYLTPEYYYKEEVSSDVARKQDYFALGSTLYYIKFGQSLLKYQKDDDSSINLDRVRELLFRRHQFIKSRQTSEQGFIDFIISLIDYKPEDRANFEKIYRNKWLNSNREIIEDIMHSNENDEEKVIMELQKSDYLINKQKEFKPKKAKKFIFKKKIKNP